MQTIRRNGNWAAALTCALILAGSAAVMNQRLWAEKHAGISVPKATDARDLSTIFRHISKDALPSIVSVETTQKSVKAGHREQDQMREMFENSPFKDLFKNDPRFKGFKDQQPQQSPKSHGMGSGFIIDASGIILTNNHVVADAEQVKVKLQDGSEYLAIEIKTDPRTDLAIIRIKPEGTLKALKLGDSDALEVGDWVMAVGSPFGLDFSVTQGIISAKGRGPRITEREDFLQTDAAINPGNSGGPLLNLNGEVIGVNTAISSRSGGNDGVGFAIPINLASFVSHQLVEKGSVSRPFLGVAIQQISNAMAKQFHLPLGHGAAVLDVKANSPADEAKVETGDVILKLDGKKINDPRSLQGIVERLEIGKKYPLEILRDGKEQTLHVVAREMPKDYSLTSAVQPAEPEKSAKPKADSFNDLGIEVQELTPELAKQLGYKESVKGVVITTVKDDSPASAAGLTTAMVIERVGNQRVHATADLKLALKGTSVEQGVLMLVRTPSGATQFVVVGKAN